MLSVEYWTFLYSKRHQLIIYWNSTRSQWRLNPLCMKYIHLYTDTYFCYPHHIMFCNERLAGELSAYLRSFGFRWRNAFRFSILLTIQKIIKKQRILCFRCKICTFYNNSAIQHIFWTWFLLEWFAIFKQKQMETFEHKVQT